MYKHLWSSPDGDSEQPSEGNRGMADPEGEFRKRWGWKVTIDELSKETNQTEEYWWGTPYIQTLNELAYRKEKNHVSNSRR